MLIRSACGENSLLRREVLNYLEYDYEGSVFVPATINVTAPEIPNATTLETRYDLGDEIARGGMGVILRAYDRNLRRDVAVKVLKEERKDDPDTLRRFVQEADTPLQSSHAGLPILDTRTASCPGRTREVSTLPARRLP